MRIQTVAITTIVIVLLTCASVRARAQEDAESNASVDEIIENYVEALGGRMSVEVESFRATGVNRSTAEPAAEKFNSNVTYLYKDGVFAIELDRVNESAADVFYGYDGRSLWVNKNNSKAKMAKADAFGWMKLIPFVAQQALHWQEWGLPITREEDTTFEDEAVAAVRIQFSEKRAVTHLFSVESGLMVASKMDYGIRKYDLHYEYIEVEGMLCISKVRILHAGSSKGGLFDYEMHKFDFENDVPAAALKRPSEDEDEEVEDDKEDKEEDDKEEDD